MLERGRGESRVILNRARLSGEGSGESFKNMYVMVQIKTNSEPEPGFGEGVQLYVRSSFDFCHSPVKRGFEAEVVH